MADKKPEKVKPSAEDANLVLRALWSCGLADGLPAARDAVSGLVGKASFDAVLDMPLRKAFALARRGQ